MIGLPKGALPFRDLPVGPYLVLDRDDHANYADASGGGGTPVHWCMCERRHALAHDIIVVGWSGEKFDTDDPHAVIEDWRAERFWCFPIDSLVADQLFMKSVHSGDSPRWHRLCDEATGVTTL